MLYESGSNSSFPALYFLPFVQLFIGFGFPYEGPAPLEAIANGCIFLQPKFNPPHSSLNHEFFRGKPTSRKVIEPHPLASDAASFIRVTAILSGPPQVSSQHPYAEQHVGRPHVYTVDFNNSEEFDAAIREIMRIDVSFLLFPSNAGTAPRPGPPRSVMLTVICSEPLQAFQASSSVKLLIMSSAATAKGAGGSLSAPLIA